MPRNGPNNSPSHYGPQFQASSGSFAAQVSAIAKESVDNMNAVVRGSVQDLAKEANRSVGQGGKMRVDTGFLRASASMSLTGMPSGPDRPVKDAKPNSYAWDAAALTIAGNLTVGQKVFFGWTAKYAGPREFYDGFLGSAVQNWQSIVDANCGKLK